VAAGGKTRARAPRTRRSAGRSARSGKGGARLVPAYGPLDDEREVDRVADLVGWAFASPTDKSREWLERAGYEHVRVLRVSGEPAAALLQLPMGQFYGHRSVPQVGIAGVAVAPEHRGGGLGAALMRETVVELHARGVALSTLYPSTQRLYRGAGWEVAGGRYEVRVAPTLLGVRERTCTVRPARLEDRPAVEKLHREVAALQNGELDRGPYVWRRVYEPRPGEPTRGLLIEHAGRLEGYVYLVETSLEGPYYELVALDARASTRRAALRLLSVLADHKTLARTVIWRGGPAGALLALVPERGYEVRQRDPWMLRICDLRAALEARGYAPGLRAELTFDVRDDVVRPNAGRWTLRVAGGRGRVTRGGAGRIALDVRALAALYSGHLSAETLHVTGTLDGGPGDLARASAVFAAEAPAMTDMF